MPEIAHGGERTSILASCKKYVAQGIFFTRGIDRALIRDVISNNPSREQQAPRERSPRLFRTLNYNVRYSIRLFIWIQLWRVRSHHIGLILLLLIVSIYVHSPNMHFARFVKWHTRTHLSLQSRNVIFRQYFYSNKKKIVDFICRFCRCAWKYTFKFSQSNLFLEIKWERRFRKNWNRRWRGKSENLHYDKLRRQSLSYYSANIPRKNYTKLSTGSKAIALWDKSAFYRGSTDLGGGGIQEICSTYNIEKFFIILFRKLTRSRAIYI